MQPLLFNLESDPSLFAELAEELDAELGALEQRTFPDGETYLRIHSDCQDRLVIVLCNLYHPDDKWLKLLFLSDTVRDLGAQKVALITPYLPYMRQDKRFNEGECVTSRPFAKQLSGMVDLLITMDPHLHRYHSLDEIYSIPSKVVAAAPLIAQWIRTQVQSPLLIGPDSESEQWVSQVASLADAPFQVLEKTRFGDRDVSVSAPQLAAYQTHTPVLVDDIISSGHTMLETISHLQQAGLPRAVCIGVHGIFAGEAYAQLSAVADVVTTQCIAHQSNRISVAQALAAGLNALIHETT